MKRVLYRALVPVVLLSACLAVAQQRSGSVRVTTGIRFEIAPEHPDWNYKVGENAIFIIKATRNGAPLDGAKVDWEAGPDMLPMTRKGTVVLTAAGARVDVGTMQEPGFLRLNARLAEMNQPGPPAVGSVGFEPEKIQAVTEMPADFDQFWAEGKAALARIPIDAQLTPNPERSTAGLDAYEVSIQNVGGNGSRGTSRVYGIVTIPKAAGKYPALLRVPGAGVYPASSIVRDHEEGVITLSIGIHGIPLTLDASVYRVLGSGALSGYQEFNLDSKEKYYYRRVYLGCVRAIDYLTSLDKWDGKTVAVMGNSQGGALAIVTAALDERVGALASFHPALSDQLGYLHGRAGGWPNAFRNAEMRTPAKIETARYYDVVNFARKLKAPGLYTWGYNDTTCAPTTTFAAFNAVTAPKVLSLQIETGHTIAPEQRARVNKWIQEFLKTGKVPSGV